MRKVFTNPALSIYELPEPAPYFEATGGRCRITPVARDQVRTECETPARLIRRELLFEGWTATVNGDGVPVGLAAPIFQAVDLPAGGAMVRFRYAPPHAALIVAAFCLGLLIVALGTMATLWRRPCRPGHEAQS